MTNLIAPQHRTRFFLAAAFLTVAPYLRQRSFRGGFANSLLGMAIGTPLGVCVNCAAPIALLPGSLAGGGRLR